MNLAVRHGFTRHTMTIAIAGFVALLSACARSVEPGAVDVTGEWERSGGGLPPISLTLTDSGSALRARLRLSGTERRGIATLDGSHLGFAFADQPIEIVGQVLSSSELQLRFNPDTSTYTLRRVLSR